MYGDARYTCPSLWPMRPGKFLRAGHTTNPSANLGHQDWMSGIFCQLWHNCCQHSCFTNTMAASAATNRNADLHVTSRWSGMWSAERTPPVSTRARSLAQGHSTGRAGRAQAEGRRAPVGGGHADLRLVHARKRVLGPAQACRAAGRGGRNAPRRIKHLIGPGALPVSRRPHPCPPVHPTARTSRRSPAPCHLQISALWYWPCGMTTTLWSSLTVRSTVMRPPRVPATGHVVKCQDPSRALDHCWRPLQPPVTPAGAAGSAAAARWRQRAAHDPAHLRGCLSRRLPEQVRTGGFPAGGTAEGGQAARLRRGEAPAVGQRLSVHVRPNFLRGRHQKGGHHHAPARAVQQPRRRLEVLRLAARARPGSRAPGSGSPRTCLGLAGTLLGQPHIKHHALQGQT